MPSDPTPGSAKAAASGAVGGIMTILVWASKQFWHLDIPPEVAVAGASLLATLAVYFVPHQLGSGQ